MGTFEKKKEFTKCKSRKMEKTLIQNNGASKRYKSDTTGNLDD